jgi:adenylate cyclase
MTASPLEPVPQGRFALSKLVIAVHDMAGYTRAAKEADELALARFMDDYYALAAAEVRSGGGRLVKLIGDAILAVFPEEKCVEAVEAMSRLREGAAEVARRHGVRVQPGHTNVHLATVASGDFGPEGDRRYDVIGSGVNHTFLLGGRHGDGVHISEAVFRRLPNDARAAWRKERPPVVYSRDR